MWLGKLTMLDMTPLGWLGHKTSTQTKLSKGILLQQDNARVHTCKIAMDAVEQNGYELIPHPTNSLDLAPSDYFLFPNLKKDIRGCHFQSN